MIFLSVGFFPVTFPEFQSDCHIYLLQVTVTTASYIYI